MRRTPPAVVGHAQPGLVDDLASGSRYRLTLLRGIYCYRIFGGVAPVFAVVTRNDVTRQVLAILTIWLLVLVMTIALWHVIERRHLVQRRLTMMGLFLDAAAGVGINLVAVMLMPGSVQDSFGDVFWFLAQVNVAAWTMMRPSLAPAAVGGWTVVACVMLVIDPDRPSPRSLPDEIGFVIVHAVWLALAAVTLITAGRLIRLGSSYALNDGVQLGRRAAQVQALRDNHDTVLQTLEAIALRAADTSGEPADELRAVGRMARWQADELRLSMHSLDAGDDIAGMLLDLRQRFVGRLDIELDLDPARVVPAAWAVRAALHGAVHECLTNVVKHAGVRQAYVQVERTRDAVTVTVRDYGRGFLPDRTPRGFGLTQSITRRLEEVGGTMDLSAVPGGGTVVTLTAPLECMTATGVDTSAVGRYEADISTRDTFTQGGSVLL